MTERADITLEEVGWAALIKRNDVEIIVTGQERKTTNNRMELMAAVSAVEMLRENEDAILYSDSQYVVEGITQWIYRWQKSDWIRKCGKPVDNQDLWETLDMLTKRGNIVFQWVKGRSSDYMKRVDKLAKSETKK